MAIATLGVVVLAMVAINKLGGNKQAQGFWTPVEVQNVAPPVKIQATSGATVLGSSAPAPAQLAAPPVVSPTTTAPGSAAPPTFTIPPGGTANYYYSGGPPPSPQAAPSAATMPTTYLVVGSPSNGVAISQ